MRERGKIAPPPPKRWATLLIVLAFTSLLRADPLPKTAPLTTEGDIASQMIDGIDRFLLKETDKAIAKRATDRKRLGDTQKLADSIGLKDPRPAKVEMELVATVDRPALVAKSDAFEAHAVRWRAFGNVHGEGLLLTPAKVLGANLVIAVPDADQTPEEVAGLTKSNGKCYPYGRFLAEHGCRVLIPTIIDRHIEKRISPGRSDGPLLSNREFVHRSAYVLGRHLIGYELQKILAAVDWSIAEKHPHISVIGWGEGGLLALLAGALDDRVKVVCSSGYFGNGANIWAQPIDRNVFGFTNWLGDAELAAMGAHVFLEPSRGPSIKINSKGAAPGEIKPLGQFKLELERAQKLNEGVAQTESDAALALSERSLAGMMALNALAGAASQGDKDPEVLWNKLDPAPRQKRQLDELIRHNTQLLANSPNVRREFLKNLDTSSLEKYEQSAKPYRETFYNDVIGRFDQPLLPPNPRTRKTWDNEKWTGYEVMLDVFPDVFAYGVLLLPKDLKPGEKRPVVVCQHGLEGRPTDTFLNDNKSYHDFAAKLAERGFITFAPQNPYIFTDRFRTLQRKANPIGKTLFSVIIPQHQQILNFLKTLPGVDEKRIAFYGLSYGGKTAMRVPAVLTDYCLSICSADFNEWVWKNAGTDHPYSYVYTGEYEIFEWNLGGTFNYAEMAALIAPRPFMVERGHFDGVSSDEMVAFEFAKVRRLYNGLLKIGDRCEIEFFAGPHTINGKGTFDFLHKHLNWEKR